MSVGSHMRCMQWTSHGFHLVWSRWPATAFQASVTSQYAVSRLQNQRGLPAPHSVCDTSVSNRGEYQQRLH